MVCATGRSGVNFGQHLGKAQKQQPELVAPGIIRSSLVFSTAELQTKPLLLLLLLIQVHR
jgi:hypothetical protein